MSQRTTVWIAAALTAFVVVMVGATALTIALKPSAVTQAETIAPAASSGNGAATNDTVPLARLSADQAAQIALNVVPNGTLTRTPELVSYQGTTAYEVLLGQGTLYVDANSGKILYNGATASANNRGGQRSGEHQEQGEGHND